MTVADEAPLGGHADGGPLELHRLTKLRELYCGEGALREFVELYVADMTHRVEQLRAAAGAGDAPAVWQAAHAMRGSCSIAGAHRVHTLLARLEGLARAGEVPDDQALAALRAASDEAAQALTREAG
ncbi:MAG: Hpt domain-containing protein [Thermoleophilia bacterium]